jgi:PPOX class probable F420-dependent enzyme
VSRVLSEREAAFVAARRVGHLATANAGGRPSVVPFCFALLDPDGAAAAIVTPLDDKPKSAPTEELARVRNIRANPRVSAVFDDYDEDWSRLGFVQVRGTAGLIGHDDPRYAPAIAALRAKYPQNLRMAIDERPLIVIEPERAHSWGVAAGEPAGARPRDLTALIQGRRSVRALRPDPVPRALIEQAIAAAGWAPSPHGRQPWRFAVIEERRRKEILADDMAASWRAQLELDGHPAEIVELRLQKSRRRLVEAPVVIVACLYLAELDAYPDEARQAAERTMAVQSFGAAIQNLMLALFAVGLDSGWMCAPLFCEDVVRASLGLDAALIPQALIPIGYAAADPVRRPRRPLDELIVDWR